MKVIKGSIIRRFTEVLLRKGRSATSISHTSEPVVSISGTSVCDFKARTGFADFIRGVFAAPQRYCIECLNDISHATERCPHCRVLQQAENQRNRRRDAGWV